MIKATTAQAEAGIDDFGYMTSLKTAQAITAQVGGGGLDDPGGNGIVVRTASNTTTARTLTAGTNVTVDNGSGVSGNPTVNVADASTTAKGVVELATDGESASGLAVQSNDGRLTNARTPTAHAASHTNGTDDIQDATASVKGLATAAQITKLDGIATNANNYSHPNHSGDVTSVGDGATTIANNAVTFAKMQQISSVHLVGRHAGGSGNIQEVSVGNGIEFSGSGIRREALTGDVTASAGSNTTTIADNAVTAAKLAATLDLSAKTLTLPSDVTRLGSNIDLASAEVTGTLPVAARARRPQRMHSMRLHQPRPKVTSSFTTALITFALRWAAPMGMFLRWTARRLLG